MLPDQANSDLRFNRRTLVLGAAQVGLLGILSYRLYDLQIVQTSKFRKLADRNRLHFQAIPPARGRILDRQARVLADNRQELALVVVPDLSNDLRDVLSKLAKIIPLSEIERQRVLDQAQRQSQILPINVGGTLSWKQFARVNALSPYLAGIQGVIRARRVYEHTDILGHVVGFTGLVERYELGADPALSLPGFRVGKAGVEFGLDQRLRGRSGYIKTEVNARGRIVRRLEHVASDPGKDVSLTIDLEIQRRVVARVIRERDAALVALDATTGEILALVSAPVFDTRQIVKGVTQKQWKQIERLPGRPMFNRAVQGQYPPGSTFKAVTALAGLQAGVISRETRLHCKGIYHHGGQTYRCWNRRGHGKLHLHRALRESCDVYFYQVAKELGINRLVAMAWRLGLGQSYDFALKHQSAGLIPTPEWKLGTLRYRWLGEETSHAGIGQAYVLATPLQLAVMMARIATGNEIIPRLTLPTDEEKKVSSLSLGIGEQHLVSVRDGLLAVAYEAGRTAHGAQFPFSNVRIAGKTNTSQVSRISRARGHEILKPSLRDHSLFAGYAPFDSPRFAIAAVVEHAGGGSKLAATLVRDVLTLLFARDTVGSASNSRT